MRRQARISAGGALVVRSASALQVWLWLLIFIFQNEFRISRSIQPGYLDFDNLPETNFTCAGKVIGGYYADLETSCQMFHVCTVGQQEEPMDIKFLCLNGTVFDQETRVCERVDEVDCTKSEKFYSLNLELYGSTISPPPITQDDVPKAQAQSTEQSVQKAKPSNEGEADPSMDESSTTVNEKQEHSSDIIDSTEDPTQDIKKEDFKNPQVFMPTHPSMPEHEEAAEEYAEEGEDENAEYEEDYSHPPTTTSLQTPTSTITTTTTSTTTRSPVTSTVSQLTSLYRQSPVPQLISSPSPTTSSISSLGSSSSSSVSPSPSIDPALLSPQEFIYRHRGPGSEAISFQSFRPADGVYITHAPPQQFDHFQYESSRTAPRPAQARPAPFVQRPQPVPFRPTTLDPRDQLLRPGPASQSSERYETSIKHRPQPYPSVLPAQRPLPFNPYYYDRKRSDDSAHDQESSLAARSVAPPTVTERPPTKPKSPPRVIVTASASVSDSNGKRLNYTVGNVVSAVKPIVPINYDDYKESDLIFDPFFLDVPKLQKRRKTRSSQNRKIFTVPATATIPPNLVTEKTIENKVSTASPAKSQATTTAAEYTTERRTTAAWNPNDYVDDNYEPHAYIPPGPPLAVLAHDVSKYKEPYKKTNFDTADKFPPEIKSKLGRVQHSQPTMSALQTTSSQIESGSAAPPSPPPPPAALPCASSRSTHCRTRA